MRRIWIWLSFDKRVIPRWWCSTGSISATYFQLIDSSRMKLEHLWSCLRAGRKEWMKTKQWRNGWKTSSPNLVHVAWSLACGDSDSPTSSLFSRDIHHPQFQTPQYHCLQKIRTLLKQNKLNVKLAIDMNHIITSATVWTAFEMHPIFHSYNASPRFFPSWLTTIPLQ